MDVDRWKPRGLRRGRKGLSGEKGGEPEEDHRNAGLKCQQRFGLPGEQGTVPEVAAKKAGNRVEALWEAGKAG